MKHFDQESAEPSLIKTYPLALSAARVKSALSADEYNCGFPEILAGGPTDFN